MHGATRHRWVRGGLATLLLTAAVLKGFTADSLAAGGWPSGTAFEWPALLAEVGLAVWLLTAAGWPLAWLVAVATFLTFAGVSLASAAAGRASCGCFGAVAVSPWVSLAIDLAAVGLLAWVRPPRAAVAGFFAGGNRRAAAWAVGPSVAVVAGWVLLADRHAVWLAAQRGERLVVRPAVLDFGAVPAGRPAAQVVTLSNRGDAPVRVVGGTADCGCVATDDLPVSVPPGGDARIRVRLRTQPAHAGKAFNHTFELWTDDGVILGRMVGRVVAP